MKNGRVVDSYGVERWYKNYFFHREDGPAVILPDGYKEYYLKGEYLTFEEWLVKTTTEGRASFLFSGEE
mgnify:CR=1 FL=1